MNRKMAIIIVIFTTFLISSTGWGTAYPVNTVLTGSPCILSVPEAGSLIGFAVGLTVLGLAGYWKRRKNK